jgi:hypothetical protein
MEWMETSPEIAEEVDVMLRKHGISAIRQAGQFLRKSPSSTLKEGDIGREVTRRLSKYITHGLVQLSIERVKETGEYRQSLRDSAEPYTVVLHKLLPLNLPEYAPRISFALKAGATEIWRTESTFAVRSLVSLTDTRITLQEHKLKEFRFGSLNAAMSIYLKKEQVEEAIHSFNRDLTVPGMMAAGKK